MSRTLLEQEAIDRANIFGEYGGFSEVVTLTTGTDSQAALGIFSTMLTDKEEQGGYSDRRFGNFLVTFNNDDITIDIRADVTTVTVRGEDYKVRRVDPAHADIRTVYLK